MSMLCFVMGTTCSGKSSFLHYARDRAPGEVGLIEVGATLRAKYPPSYFQGQASPEHTAQEAWDICLEGIKEHSDKALVLIDGQPRDYDQTHKCLQLRNKKKFVLLDAWLENRESRLRNRFPGNPEAFELGRQRLRNDMQSYYVVLVELIRNGTVPEILDTNGPREQYEERLFQSLWSEAND